MENTTMTNGTVATTNAMTDAATRVRFACPQPATSTLLAPVFGGHQGRIVPSGAARPGAGLSSSTTTTTYTFNDVVDIRSGRPPV